MYKPSRLPQTLSALGRLRFQDVNDDFYDYPETCQILRLNHNASEGFFEIDTQDTEQRQ